MEEKQSREIKEEAVKKATRGIVPANTGAEREQYRVSGYTPAGDRITPYEADEDLGEKGNIQE